MKYNLRDIATVSGLPGLYKVVSPTRTGVILESIDETKKRMMTQTRHKLSLLQEISIFVTSTENSVSLEDVFENILNQYGKDLKLDYKTASNDQLFEFMGSIVENYDPERVYPSDVKKLIQWYNIISTFYEPEASEDEKKKEEKKETKKKPAAKKEAKASTGSKKTTAKKTTTKKKTTKKEA